MAKQASKSDKKVTETDKDLRSGFELNGNYQRITKDPVSEYSKPTLAAGAVIWRKKDNEDQVAIIHRPHYNDWSLAKGKVDPGESLPACCAREIEEETGYQIKLGSLLGTVSYPVLGRTKVVFYWNSEVISGSFGKNGEVDKLKWLSVKEANKQLTYDTDRKVLKKAAKRRSEPADTRILYIRHAKAHERKNWSGDDNLRPLNKKGRRQAEMLVAQLLPYRPTAIYSAEPDRCQATAAPLSDELSLPIVTDRLLGDIALDDLEAAQERFDEIAHSGGVPVVVSQGGMMPEIVDWLAQRSNLTLDTRHFKKSGVWVLSLRDGELIGADYLASPLPVK